MTTRPRVWTLALASSLLFPFAVAAQDAERELSAITERELSAITVTASPFGSSESVQILSPTRVLAGDALRDRLGATLGDVLAQEPGVSASGFGAGASRPVIRGLGGPRVKVVQNGLGVVDVSTLSEDHAVGIEAGSARQVEILRGPATLLYGSGAIGGLVNVVNERIPTERVSAPTGDAEARFGTAADSKAVSFSLEAPAGSLGLHVDGSWLDAGNHDIPGRADAKDPDSARGRLPLSYTKHDSLGVGISHIGRWGYAGASVSSFNNAYGVPSEEGAHIDLAQLRYDVAARIDTPFAGIESLSVKLGYSDYEHTEFDRFRNPHVHFDNRALETRWEVRHAPLSGWRGVFGVQTEEARFAALPAEHDHGHHHATVPATDSRSLAAFIVEEKDFGPLRANAGLRFESVEREPADGPARRFDLASWSLGGLWTFAPGHALGTTFSHAQRAPSAEELYSHGAHHATDTFDIGNPDLARETSRNIELSLQKTSGLLRWKANLFYNRIDNFVYGRLSGNEVDEHGHAGGHLDERIFSQADAVVRGAEAEIGYNQRGPGVSVRGFADTARGKFRHGGGNLPLQPATRFGVELGYRAGDWHSGVSVVHALRQKRLAAFETNPAPSYTRMDAKISYTQRLGMTDLTWFALLHNLLDEDIRLSTSLLKDTTPQPGRSLLVGVRARF